MLFKSILTKFGMEVLFFVDYVSKLPVSRIVTGKDLKGRGCYLMKSLTRHFPGGLRKTMKISG
jgi:hypothetical protein